MSEKRRYFGTDGVRGKVGVSPITPDFVMRPGGQLVGFCPTARAERSSSVKTLELAVTCLNLRSRPG